MKSPFMLLLTIAFCSAGALPQSPVAQSGSHSLCVTAHPEANEQLLYFTSSSLLADDRRLVFIGDRTGSPNIFVRDMKSGDERQLTFNASGILKSYVYFNGHPYRGFGKASVSVHTGSGTIYYIQGRQICAVDTQGHHRVLAEYPAGQMTAFTHVSADGSLLCVPTTDARALDGDAELKGKPGYDIDGRVRNEHLSSYLRIYDTGTGKELICERVANAWVTHVQFSPKNSKLILYNHEWPSDCGIRRMWLWDGVKHTRLRTEGEGRSAKDWTCHEMWTRDGESIIYHGSYHNGAAFIGSMKPDGSGRVEIALPSNWKRYGHFTEGNSATLVTDGYYQQADDEADQKFGGAWICVLNVNWNAKHIGYLPLCRHGSSWGSQDAHPHPIFNHAGNAVFFTSDKSGHRAIYKASLPEGEKSSAPSRVEEPIK